MSAGDGSDAAGAREPIARVVAAVLSLFALLGLGVGVTGFLAVGQIGGSGFSGRLVTSAVAVAALGVALFGGPVVAALLALQGRFDRGSDRATAAVAFAGTTPGYVVMVVLAGALVAAGTPDTSRALPVSDALLLSVVLAVPTGLVAVAAALLGARWPQ